MSIKLFNDLSFRACNIECFPTSFSLGGIDFMSTMTRIIRRVWNYLTLICALEKSECYFCYGVNKLAVSGALFSAVFSILVMLN